jgi:hypothetical protein
MDRQEKAKKNEGSENGSDHGSNEESDNEEKVRASDFCTTVVSGPVCRRVFVL